MKVLGIDTSSLATSVAVIEDNKLICEYTINTKKTHSQKLMPMIENMLNISDLNINDIDLIAVCEGPGSFTGLRIGSATAKGLGLALNKPLIHIPTLDGLAYNLYGNTGLVCPIMDARRNQVYTGIYRFEDGEFQVVEEQMAISVQELIEKLNQYGEQVTFLGDGVPVYKASLVEGIKQACHFAPAHMNRQRAASVATLALKYYEEGKTETAEAHRPDYLRLSQAERERAEKDANCS